MTQRGALEHQLAKFRAAHPALQLIDRGGAWRYYAGGKGAESVLLLGGALGLAELGFQQILLLEPHFRVLAPDYPPVGSLVDICGGLVALLSAEHIPSAHVVGGSFGGFLAQTLVRQAPERVASLVLSHTGSPDARRRRGVGVFALLPVSLLRTALRARLGRTLGAADPFWRGYFEHATGTLSKADIMSRLRIQREFGAARYRPDDLARWPGRVLILEAEDDPLFRSASRERLRALYPTAQVHQFQGTGHAAAILQPEDYAAVLTRFFTAAA
jgi:pimeloyl-ACP methyl ester carboxylesterase